MAGAQPRGARARTPGASTVPAPMLPSKHMLPLHATGDVPGCRAPAPPQSWPWARCPGTGPGLLWGGGPGCRTCSVCRWSSCVPGTNEPQLRSARDRWDVGLRPLPTEAALLRLAAQSLTLAAPSVYSTCNVGTSRRRRCPVTSQDSRSSGHGSGYSSKPLSGQTRSTWRGQVSLQSQGSWSRAGTGLPGGSRAGTDHMGLNSQSKPRCLSGPVTRT